MQFSQPLDELAAGNWEACAHYEGDVGGLCTTCGWLDADHVRDAEIVTLTPPRRHVAERRLAS